MQYYQSRKKGFTLLEVLLSIAIIGLVAGLSVPIFQQIQTRRTTDVELHQTVLMIRRAQTLARSGYYDDDWGISIIDDTVTLFKGDDYSSRDTDFDEVITFSNAEIDTDVEIFFSQEFGIPNDVFSSVFTTTNDYQLTISMNEQGSISI